MKSRATYWIRKAIVSGSITLDLTEHSAPPARDSRRSSEDSGWIAKGLCALILIVEVVSGQTVFAQSFTASEYFPLQSGSQWTYLENGAITRTETVLPGTVLVNGVQTIRVQSSRGFVSYYTNDFDGIRLHRLDDLDPAQNSSTVFSPPIRLAGANISAGDIFLSDGTATLTAGLGTFFLNYSATAEIEALEDVTVPLRTFSTGRLKATLNLNGTILGTPVNETEVDTFWLAKHIGPVKQSIQLVGDPADNFELTAVSLNTDDDLVMDFEDFKPGGAFGLWAFINNAIWKKLDDNGLARFFIFAEAIVTAQLDPIGLDDVVVDLGSTWGLWAYMNNSGWVKLSRPSPDGQMVVGDIDGSGLDDLVIDFAGGLGLWARLNDSNWKKINDNLTENMIVAEISASGIDDLVADFGSTLGLWAYIDNVSWIKLNESSPEGQMVAGDIDGNGVNDLVIEFGGALGLWARVNHTAWKKLNNNLSESIVIADLDVSGHDDVVVDFGPNLGLWAYMNDTVWVRLNEASPVGQMEVGDIDGNGVDDLVIEFGGALGLWARLNNTTWKRLNGNLSESIVIADLDGNAQGDVVVDYGSTLGVWAYMNNATWVKLTGASPPRPAAVGNIDGT